MTIFVDEEDYYGCIALLHKEILLKRAKPTILEYTTRELFSAIPERVQIAVCDKINNLNEMGGSVVTGIELQMRLGEHFEESIAKSIEYVKNGNEWFHCDHIAERVLGHALLTEPERTMPLFRKMISDEDKWVVRMVGVAGHYAVKNGLKRPFVRALFDLLLDHSDNEEFHVRRGLGRAAKTTAKCHPDIAAKHLERHELGQNVGNWFRTNVENGISGSGTHPYVTHQAIRH